MKEEASIVQEKNFIEKYSKKSEENPRFNLKKRYSSVKKSQLSLQCRNFIERYTKKSVKKRCSSVNTESYLQFEREMDSLNEMIKKQTIQNIKKKIQEIKKDIQNYEKKEDYSINFEKKVTELLFDSTTEGNLEKTKLCQGLRDEARADSIRFRGWILDLIEKRKQLEEEMLSLGVI